MYFISRDLMSVVNSTFSFNVFPHRSVSKVHDEWFVDEERVRKVVGFPEKRIEMPNDREVHHYLN